MANAEKDYSVRKSAELSSAGNPRYVVVDAESGEVLDDAQGYGYKSVQNAHAAWSYKSRTVSNRQRIKSVKEAVRKWLKTHPDIEEDLENISFRAAKEGREDEFNARFVQEYLKSRGFQALPFSAAQLLRYW